MDPVKFRVAIPAADPPDNITHDYRYRARSWCHVT
jgi:SulP family sulfate permease